jgi:hypothetical protein
MSSPETLIRLTHFEIDAIKQSAIDVFGPGVQIILFGSRIEPLKKGGDIDLYIQTESDHSFLQKIKFLLAVEQKIGEQKIDVIFAEDQARPIEQQAISQGILLWCFQGWQSFLNECDKHLMRLNHAEAKMVLFMPLNADSYLTLSEDEIEHIDQFLFRFAKLQDTIGEKLIISILEYLQE